MQRIKEYFKNLLKGIVESLALFGIAILTLIGSIVVLILTLFGVKVEDNTVLDRFLDL